MTAAAVVALPIPPAAGAYYDLTNRTGPWSLTLAGDVDIQPADGVTPLECLGPDGTLHAAVRIVGAQGLLVDLRGHSLRMTPDAADRHRRCVLVLLQHCSNVVIEGGRLGRASEACLALQHCRDVEIRDIAVGDFEVTGVSLEACSGVLLERVTVAGHFNGSRPSPEASLLAAYLPLLRSLQSPAEPLLRFCERTLDQRRSTGAAEHFGCFGLLATASSGVRVRSLVASAPLHWSPPAWTARSAPASNVPPEVLAHGGFCPCQGLFRDVCPVEPSFIADFLIGIQSLLRGNPALARRLIFVAPLAQAPCSTEAGGFMLNCGQAVGGFLLTPGGALAADGELPRCALSGVDLFGRRVRGAALVWLEDCPGSLVESLDVACCGRGVVLEPLAPQAEAWRRKAALRLGREVLAGGRASASLPRPQVAALVRWRSDVPFVAQAFPGESPEHGAVLLDSQRMPDPQAPAPRREVFYVAPRSSGTTFMSVRPGGSREPLGGSSFSVSFPPQPINVCWAAAT